MTCCILLRPLKSLFALFVVIATASSTHGELPPAVYKDLQKKSPEALMIKVESVKISTANEPTVKVMVISAEARVETVIRSASGLKPGDKLRINYVHLEHKEPLAGPSEPDVLQEGQVYPAFLSKVERNGSYALAAEGYSFRKAN